eukprot:symbB.v1.2.017673.t1/scaffold1380.1/size122483/11
MAMPEAPPEETEEVAPELAIPELHSVVEGSVASVRPFGAFIRIGKGDHYKDGLAHISAIAAGRVEKVSDFLDVGDKVWAKVVNIKEEEGKYGLDLRYVNQQTGEDLDPRNREGRFPKGGGKQKKQKTEDLVNDAKAMMEEVKRMKKESKLKKKFLKLEEKRKKKLQKKIKKQAKARGEKEFGFPEPVAKQEMHANGNGQGITLKERKDASKKVESQGGKRPKATADDLEGLERFRKASPKADKRMPRDEPREPRRRGRDSREPRRRESRPRGRPPPPVQRRSDSRSDSRSPPPRKRRPRRSQAKVVEEEPQEEPRERKERLTSREKRRLYASGVADEATAEPQSTKTSKAAKKAKVAEPMEKSKKEKLDNKERPNKSKEEDHSNGEAPKQAKRKKKYVD